MSELKIYKLDPQRYGNYYITCAKSPQEAFENIKAIHRQFAAAVQDGMIVTLKVYVGTLRYTLIEYSIDDVIEGSYD